MDKVMNFIEAAKQRVKSIDIVRGLEITAGTCLAIGGILIHVASHNDISNAENYQPNNIDNASEQDAEIESESTDD